MIVIKIKFIIMILKAKKLIMKKNLELFYLHILKMINVIIQLLKDANLGKLSLRIYINFYYQEKVTMQKVKSSLLILKKQSNIII